MIKVPWEAKQVLDGVERWAKISGFELIREIKLNVDSRIDGLLVPVSKDAPMMGKNTKEYFWRRAGFVGVEVKMTRTDFMSGLRKDQYDRYDGLLPGIYVATPPKICKTSELPPQVGHIIVHRKPYETVRKVWGEHREWENIVTCRRHPSFTISPVDEQLFWRVFFRMKKQQKEEMKIREKVYKEAMKSAGEKMARLVAHEVRRIARNVDDEFGVSSGWKLV